MQAKRRVVGGVFGLSCLLAACVQGGRPRTPAPPAPAVTHANLTAPAAVEPAAVSRGGTLTVRFLDVGQGDAALLTTDDGHSLLVDAGPPEPEVAEHVASALRGLGSAAIDAVIVTHPHADHVGRLDELSLSFHFDKWLDPGIARATLPFYAAALASVQQHVFTARRGAHLPLGAHVDVVILAPTEPLLEHTRSDLNANSVVLRVDHHAASGDVRVLMEADAEAPTEKRLLEDAPSLRADVLKVAHHGSRHASSTAMLDAVAPRLAVISCGQDNDYGHPHAQTLERLVAHHVAIVRTDLEGDITVTSDDRGLTWATDRPASAPALRTPGAHAGREAP